MTKKEVFELLFVITNFYENNFDFPLKTEERTDSKVQTYYTFLGEYEKDLVFTATKTYMANNHDFPPNPGKILNEIQKLIASDEDKMTAGEAWQELNYCIQRYGVNYPDMREKCIEHLPEKIYKAALQTGGLRYISENMEFVHSRFIENFKYIQEEEKQERLLPSSLKKERKQIEHKTKKQRELQEKKNKLASKFTGNQKQLTS